MRKSFNALVAIYILTVFGCSDGSTTNGKGDASVSEVASPSMTLSDSSVVMYGSDGCSHCVHFKQKLDSAGVGYIFNEIEDNNKNVLALQSLLAQYKIRERIKLPVIHLNKDTLLISPDPIEFIEFLGVDK